MRTCDIPYVKNGIPAVYSTNHLDEMNLREIVDKYIKTCGKAGGKLSECTRCEPKCEFGKRALDLYAGKTNIVPVPLVDGKTMLERAKEESARLRKETESKRNIVSTEDKGKVKKTKKGKAMDGWYEKAYQSEEPLRYIMELFEISERKAKQKVYAYQHLHPELRETMPLWEPAKQGKPQEKKEIEMPVLRIEGDSVAKVKADDKAILELLENKVNALMKQQDEYKEKAEYYQKLYQETKAKADALFEALNVINE